MAKWSLNKSKTRDYQYPPWANDRVYWERVAWVEPTSTSKLLALSHSHVKKITTERTIGPMSLKNFGGGGGGPTNYLYKPIIRTKVKLISQVSTVQEKVPMCGQRPTLFL